jgi:hypothetical protein
LFSGNASSDKFGSIGGSLNGLLTLGKPFNRSLVDKIKDTSTRPSSSEIMHEIGILLVVQTGVPLGVSMSEGSSSTESPLTL